MSNASKNGENGRLTETLEELLWAGVELGVAEAVRRLSRLKEAQASEGKQRPSDLLDPALLSEFVDAIRQDASGAVQLIKEVWSRGGVKERKTAAKAVGSGLGRIAPHKALGLSRDLAAMARNAKEADMVGSEAIGPLLEANPPLFDRVKQFAQDHQPLVRRAAIAGLVAYASRKRKWAGLALQVVLVLAEEREKEIKSAIRLAIRELSKVDWKATGQAIVDWAQADPTGGRARQAKQYASAAADSVKREVERFVFSNLARFAEGNPVKSRR